MKKKGILGAVIDELRSEKSRYRLSDLKYWLDFLRNGKLFMTPNELRRAFEKVFENEDMKPRGDKLLYPRRSTKFTVKSGDIPGRDEEALERFIIVSNNQENCCNQFPIGGGKESIDIAILNDQKRHEFIELESWDSEDTPIYAIVEILKNHFEYQIIKKEKIKHHEKFTCFNEVDLVVLAPRAYYKKYNLINKETALPENNNLQLLKKVLNDLSSEFEINISLMVLPLEKQTFIEKCNTACNKYRKQTGKEEIGITKDDSIPELARDKWEPLVSSDKDLS